MKSVVEKEEGAKLRREWIWGALLIASVIMAYLPVWRAGFVWDDSLLIVKNPCISAPDGLRQIWTTSAADICPLTLTTFYLEHALWGFAPLPFHVVNVLVHAACAVLLWRVLLALRIPGAWLGAVLWALHPVNAESVAWITELKNTQSGLFFLLSVHFFVQWLKDDKPSASTKTHALMFACAFCAMASKSSTVILPLVLCLCAWWIEGRLRRRVIAGVGPIFLLSLAASLLSLWTQKLQLGLVTDRWSRTIPERVVSAGDAVWFYIGKLLWPHPVISIYPRWQIDAGSAISYLPGLAVILVLLILWLNVSTWSRPWFFAFAYFLIASLPTLGLFENLIFRFSLVFDHFQYLGSMGPLALIGAGFARFVPPEDLRLRSTLGTGLLALLGILTWQRAATFRSEQTLWTHTLASNPDSWAAHNNLGVALFAEGKLDEAMSHYQRALALNANFPAAYSNLGMILQKNNHGDDAIAEYQQALRHDPAMTKVYNDLGSIYLRKGQVDLAIENFRKAIALDPKLAAAHYDLGMALSQQGKADEALAEDQEAVQLDPSDDEAHNNLGVALGQKGRIDEALPEFEKAVIAQVGNEAAHRNLGNARLQKGDLDAAISEYQKALALDADDADCHLTLGMAYGRKGDFPSAIAQFREVVRLRPADAAAKQRLEQAEAMVNQKK